MSAAISHWPSVLFQSVMYLPVPDVAGALAPVGVKLVLNVPCSTAIGPLAVTDPKVKLIVIAPAANAVSSMAFTPALPVTEGMLGGMTVASPA